MSKYRRTLRPAASRRVRRHASQKNFLYNFDLARATKNSSKKEKEVFLLGSALNRAGRRGFALHSGAAEFPPHPPSAAPLLQLADFGGGLTVDKIIVDLFCYMNYNSYYEAG